MEYELIPEEIYDRLPEEPAEKFAVLARTAQASIARLIDIENSSGDFTAEVRTQFVETMRAAGDALGIEGLPTESDTYNLSPYEEYRFFSTRLSAIVTKVRLQSQLLSRPYSVQLGRITKAKIRQEAEQLRVYISESDLPEKKKKLVERHIDQLLSELDKQRLSFGQVTAITAAISATIASGVTAISRAPEAYQVVTNILASIGDDKIKEDAERERLAPPPKALPAPSPAAAKSGFNGFGDDLDDDVPF